MLDTDLSKSPYYDDYDQTKNFYRVLYRPSVAVQARELNQMQSILQDQIDKFGRQIFKDGSVVEGCAFTFNNQYDYVKINDNYSNNYAIGNVSDFNGQYVTNDNGLKALVINTYQGFQSQDPDLNTLYLKYLNSATYPNGASQSTFSNNETLAITTSANVNVGNVVVASVSNVTGKGYAFTTTGGVIFKKGFFVRVEPQTLIVSKYDNSPDNISVGFEADELLVTPEVDTSLLDNAAGSPNYAAPGAHRLKIVPTLVTKAMSDYSNTTTFFSLCDFQKGLPISIKNDPQYSSLGIEQARRTYETNGNFVVNPFFISTETKYEDTGSANTGYMSLVTSSGIGYVKGYRVEFINNSYTTLRKGTDIKTINNQIISPGYGYYMIANEFVGDFNAGNYAQVELHSVTKQAITNRTFLNSSYSSASKIGTAYVKAVTYDNGTPGVDAKYRVYLFNIQMSASRNLSEVRSLIYYSSSVKAVADVVLSKDFSGANVAQIQASSYEAMIRPFGQRAIVKGGFSNSGGYTTQYNYRKRDSATFQTGGYMTVTISAPSEQFSYQSTIGLSSPLESTWIVTPTTNGYTTAKSGTIQVYTTNGSVVGSSTSFTSNYNVGDYIYINSSDVRRVTAIANNTSMTVDSPLLANASGLSHQKMYPAGIPINFQGINGRTITTTSSTSANLVLGESLSATFNATVYFDVQKSASAPVSKAINRSTMVIIQANTHPNGNRGPWCLGMPDVVKLNHVYVGTQANTSNPDLVNSFTVDNGQRESYYDMAYLYTTSPVDTNAILLVSVDNFTYNESAGVGFFTVDSYPIDDANTSNTSAIQTWQIPIYTSSTTGTSYDLRDCLDFRSYAVNTAVANATSNSTATVNPSSTLTVHVPTGGSYVPSPDLSFNTSLQYYLPRVDLVSMTTDGKVKIIEGTSSTSPTAPRPLTGTMPLATIYVQPYPSLTPLDARTYNRDDYATTVNLQQTRRYTMADIGKIDNRVSRLEYYTSLNLLEQQTNALLVKSGVTGQNRFKNGIFVDPFNDMSISDTKNSSFRIAIDAAKSEARPYFMTIPVKLYPDLSMSTNIVKTGSIYTLPYTSDIIMKQAYASGQTAPTTNNNTSYIGSIELDPPGDTIPDYAQGAIRHAFIRNDTVFSTNESDDLVQYIATAWGAVWPPGTQTFNKRSTLTATNLRTFGYTENRRSLAYARARFVFFTGTGFKPTTRLYTYLDDTGMSAVTIQTYPYSGTITMSKDSEFRDHNPSPVPVAANGWPLTATSNGATFAYKYNSWGTSLTTDANGSVYGIFIIPPKRFPAANLNFVMMDSNNVNANSSQYTTYGSKVYYGAFGEPVSVDNISIEPDTTKNEGSGSI